jgi:hypothetical protein
MDRPIEKNADNAALEKRLWDAAGQLRANSELKSQEYSAPVLDLIFVQFAEVCLRHLLFRTGTPPPTHRSRNGESVAKLAENNELQSCIQTVSPQLLFGPVLRSIGYCRRASMD